MGQKTDPQNTTSPKTVKIPPAKQLIETAHYRSLTHICSLGQSLTITKQDIHSSLSSLLSACNLNVFSLYRSIWVSVCWPQQEHEWRAA